MLLSLFTGTSIIKSFKNESRLNSVEPLGWKWMAPVFKFGPALQDLLMARSVSKVVQVFRTARFQQLKHFLIPPPVFIQPDDGICGSGAVITVNSSSCIKEEEQEQAAVLEEERTPADATLSPDDVQSHSTGPERPPLRLPYTPTIFPQTNIPTSVKFTQVVNWRNAEEANMLHQKQTSPQLLQFLKSKANGPAALQVRAWSAGSTHAPGSPQPDSASVEVRARQPKRAADDVIDTEVPERRFKDQTQVFKVKRAESSGSLTYAYVTATATELWDLGDIFTEAGRGDPGGSRVDEDEAYGNGKHEETSSRVDAAGPAHEGARGAQTPAAVSGIAIPEFQIHRFGETEVVVSHIVSPGNFYIQQVDSINELHALITK